MRIHLISGFMGAGKTTFVNRYLPLLSGRNAVVINDDGDVSVDAELLTDAGLARKLPSGCICCTMKTDFVDTVIEILQTINPDNLVVEVAGAANLSDIQAMCAEFEDSGLDVELEKSVVLVEVPMYRMYASGLGAFYENQVASADVVLLTHLEEDEDGELESVVASIMELNDGAIICESDYRELSDLMLRCLIGVMPFVL